MPPVPASPCVHPPARPPVTEERVRELACLGGHCAIRVAGDGLVRDADAAVELAVRRLRGWHERFTRFDTGSELMRLNADPRDEVPVTPTMALLVDAVIAAGARTGGLVDGTRTHEIESLGYV